MKSASLRGRRVNPVAVAMPLLLFGIIAFVGLMVSVVGVAAFVQVSGGLEDPKHVLDNLSFEQQTIVYDSTGKVELARFGGQKRSVVGYSDLPAALIDATTSVEDHTFWQNSGFDPLAIGAAALDSLRGRSRGASTITQQLVRARLLPDYVLLGNEYQRKIEEIIQSIRLTEDYDGPDGKQQILTAYLNQNFYGNQSYGVAAAARTYFGVTDLHKLTLAQGAILAAIPQSPTDYDLVRNAVRQTNANGNVTLVVPPDRAIVQRRNYVLDLMKQFRVLTAPGQPGAITDAQLDAAKNEAVVLAPQASANWRAPQFVWQVRAELNRILCPQTPSRCDRIDTQGYTVKTTLDWNMQRTAEKWVQAAVFAPNQTDTARYLKTLKLLDLPWIENLKGKNIHNGALIAIDYRTGHVMAYVGSASYYSQSETKQFQPQFDVLSSGWRQPGSAFKPINYITGLENRTFTPATVFMDVTTDFGGGYIPTDADNLERGPVRLREALMFSLNIPAVKAALVSGPDTVFAEAQKFGIALQSQTNQAGASIGIGTLELHPADLASAYGAIADNGTLMPRSTVLSITDSSGKEIWPTTSNGPQGKQVVSAQAAYLIQNILSANTDPVQNPYWGKADIMAGNTRRPAALKTGTTNDTKDLMAFGFLAPQDSASVPSLAVGAWLGNSDNSRTGGAFSLESAALLWQGFLTEASAKQPIADFRPPPGIDHATIDAFTGQAAGSGGGSGKTVDEVFIQGTAPQGSGSQSCASVGGSGGASGGGGILAMDSSHPDWLAADQDWLSRARQGPGVKGGPAKGTKTATAYCYEPGFQPFGATWGPQIGSGGSGGGCGSPSASPSASGSASPSPSASGICGPAGELVNPDGSLVLDANGQPIPCPSASPSQSTLETAGPTAAPPTESSAPTEAPPPTAEPTPAPTPEPTPPPTPEPTPAPTPPPPPPTDTPAPT